MPAKDSDIISRAELIQQAIATLQLSIQQIQASGEVAPPGCCVLRYQARGKQGTYWYYKLQANQPIFPTQQPDKLSKYKHLGKAGSPNHIHAVLSVARRNQIDHLQSCIDSLRQNWVELYDSLKEKK
ncbi:hypothetical protein [Sphaerospermopsis torques-reginae]|uniref:Transposase n=1 Tax=Sphaerospermopsis torques-reginae ITEP-024 TaxID=984208 RepID=A0ABX8X205_9CYAN|nr:hypothetical protein [Sphaerospermopsis torques-reginae]QYX32714.1 hypothetical protein K2F26_04895 [Sphaerospermopsis torques-reginae ITEP-024]